MYMEQCGKNVENSKTLSIPTNNLKFYLERTGAYIHTKIPSNIPKLGIDLKGLTSGPSQICTWTSLPLGSIIHQWEI
jgi:hypothetical protein